MKEKITVVGAGFVGMSLSVLLAKDHKVKIFDIDKEKIRKIKSGKPSIADPELIKFWKKNKLDLIATSSLRTALKSAGTIIICVSTNFDKRKNNFNTSAVEEIIKKSLELNENATVVIKSTVPIGFTDFISKEFKTNRIFFSPEFLREDKVIEDNLYPSRIIIGANSKRSKDFAKILCNISQKKNKVFFMKSSEAEAVKLFSNTYLAMRVSFFNELDNFNIENKLDSKSVIEGVCADERIGDFYNNPSFGYGGYCLPKDTKQLLSHFSSSSNELIQAIVASNSLRKDFLTEQILRRNPKKVGVYHLDMKQGSNNFRQSSILGIIKRLIDNDIEIIIYEPKIKNKRFLKSKIINDLKRFKKESDIIIANRLSEDLNNVRKKVFSRDIFGKD